MKTVLISIKPKWCELIASGKKTVEVRKTKPNIDVPFKCYIYCTGSNECGKSRGYISPEHFAWRGSAIGEFVCRNIDDYGYYYSDGVDIDDDALLETMLERNEINIYAKGRTLYGWHISDLVIYDKPKELSEFYPIKPQGFTGATDKEIKRYPLTRPPQSWCYVEEVRL